MRFEERLRFAGGLRERCQNWRNKIGATRRRLPAFDGGSLWLELRVDESCVGAELGVGTRTAGRIFDSQLARLWCGGFGAGDGDCLLGAGSIVQVGGDQDLLLQ